MKEKVVPYTEKHPFLYQVYLSGYIIETTDKNKFDKLMDYLKVYCNNDSYIDLPASKRLTIEINYTVKSSNAL